MRDEDPQPHWSPGVPKQPPTTLGWSDDQVGPLGGFRRMLVSAIAAGDVQRFAGQQIAPNLSPGSAQRRRRALRAVLSHAPDQLINGDPIKKVRRGPWPERGAQGQGNAVDSVPRSIPSDAFA